ncbi:MAG TPA: MBL fold metallo-hydrolase [Ignavibacteriaceae bacterium]|nr:MBL fold metallo-hydrolase [Ignavibacteriaceae bacterium]
MKLTFLGTRGEIKLKTGEHKRHTSLLVSYKNKNVIIDRGTDWLHEKYDKKPDAILVTHSHDDHAGGLQNGAPCKVYAAKDCIKKLKNFRDLELIEIEEEKKYVINEISFTAYPVEHSVIAPAVGYKITAGKVSVFYCPDLIYIYNRKEALKNVKLYVGDGAAISKSFIRKRGDKLIGHAKVQQQISWCEKEKIPEAVITHCGSEIVTSGDEKINKLFEDYKNKYGVNIRLAYDRMEVLLR